MHYHSNKYFNMIIHVKLKEEFLWIITSINKYNVKYEAE